MNILFSAFCFLVEFYIAFDAFGELFEKRHKTRYTVLIGLALYGVALISFSLFENMYINMLVFLLVNLAFSLLAFDCTIKGAIICSVLLAVLMAVTEFLTIAGATVALNGDIFSYSTDFTSYIIGSLISKLLYFLTAKFTVNYGFRDKIQNTVPSFLLLYPIISIVTLSVFWVISSNYELSGIYRVLIIITAVTFMITIILTYIFYGKNTEELAQLYKSKREADRIVTDMAYYDILDKQNEELKTFVHDEKNHLLAIKALANNKEVSSYIDSIYSDIKYHSMFGNTKNKYLDLLINKYNSICKANGIDFEINIKTANLSFMQPPDLIIIVSNILDNATKAAMDSERKKIVFSINTANGFDFIDCINSCDEKPKVVKNILQTIKNDKDKHGYGIKSIKQVTRKYKGEFSWNYSETEKQFKTSLIFGKSRK
ncbi:MAG: GHKL domain-containing protein [Clostridia bacterium]|nr:GHKL domain-containing protein [Clostridia bacterium]